MIAEVSTTVWFGASEEQPSLTGNIAEQAGSTVDSETGGNAAVAGTFTPATVTKIAEKVPC